MSRGTIVMAAPNGARRGKAEHPNLPITAEELAAEAVRCLKAGATALHMHVRDEEGAHSLDPELYRAAMEAVRGAVGDDLVLQITTEAIGRFSAEEQMASVRSVVPEAVSIGLREILPEGAGAEPAGSFFAWMVDEGIWSQLILYDVGDVERFIALNEAGLFAARRPSVLLVLGRYTEGQRSEPDDLDPLLAALAPVRDKVEWSVCAFGPKENICIARAIGEGGHGRVGFENNLYLPDGEIAEHTADLVSVAAEAAQAEGRPPLKAEELRSLIRDWL